MSDQIRVKIKGNWNGDEAEFADMPWEDSVYIAIKTADNFTNIIIKREDLEKFMKASKPKKNSTKDKLKAMKIGTRFLSPTGTEYIKVGNDNFIETNEEMAKAGFKASPGFVHVSDFSTGKITVVDE